MNKHTPELTQPQLPFDEIPYGYCHCGCGQKTNIARKTDARKGWVRGEPVRYRANHHIGKRGITLRDTFYANINPAGKTDCWTWKGAIDVRGYGTISISKIKYLAHRLSYELHHGPIPKGLFVCHNCPGQDRPSCVNPAHLWLGTHAENMADMRAKGRQSRGSNVWTAKLTETDIIEIRRLSREGLRNVDIAARFGVDDSMICRIIAKKYWAHVVTP